MIIYRHAHPARERLPKFKDSELPREEDTTIPHEVEWRVIVRQEKVVLVLSTTVHLLERIAMAESTFDHEHFKRIAGSSVT